MFCLQGYEPSGKVGVSSCAIGGMLGNAMSLNIVGRILVCALPAACFDVPTGFVDLWPSAMGLDVLELGILVVGISGVISLLNAWVQLMGSDTSLFGLYVRNFCDGSLPLHQCRCCDILSLLLSLTKHIIGQGSAG